MVLLSLSSRGGNLSTSFIEYPLTFSKFCISFFNRAYNTMSILSPHYSVGASNASNLATRSATVASKVATLRSNSATLVEESVG